jgi:thiamine-monophosphate kinase
MDLSEDELIEAIRRVLSGAGPEVLVGPGDDAAVVTSGSGELVLTTDAMVEDVHFRLDQTTPRDLGYKALAINVSDIAAMAAGPRYALCALTLSERVDSTWVVELAAGMRECSEEFGLALVGGNLARGPVVSIAITATGEVGPGRAVRRDGARPGDRVVVTGSLGGAAAGRRLAEARSWSDEERDALRRWMRPTPRVGEAGVLGAHGVTAMIDVSDGFALDLSRLARAGDAGARVELGRIPVHAAATRAEALGGGEDYELLATLPDVDDVERARAELDERFGVSLTDVGGIIDEGLVAVEDDGVEHRLEVQGWDHFG